METVLETPAEAQTGPGTARPGLRFPPQRYARAAFWGAWGAVLFAAIHLGLTERRWVWDVSALPAAQRPHLGAWQWAWDPAYYAARFPGDIQNGWARGTHVWETARRVVEIDRRHDHLPRSRDPRLTWRQFFRGYLVEYDRVADEHPKGDFGLDYSPLRLLIMSAWVKHTRDVLPRVRGWRDDLTGPLLTFNTGCELTAALAAMVLVAYWVRRSEVGTRRRSGSLSLWERVRGRRRASPQAVRLRESPQPDPLAERERVRPPRFYEGWSVRAGACGLVAFLLAWFNPAAVIEAHAWPQWEVWVLPAFLLAALMVSVDWPIAAGAFLAVGCMMKGQLLLTSPVLVLWPLLQGRVGTAGRVVVGFAATFMALAGPWLLRTTPAWAWVLCVLQAVGVACAWRYWPRADWRAFAVLVVVATLLVAWPWLRLDGGGGGGGGGGQRVGTAGIWPSSLSLSLRQCLAILPAAVVAAGGVAAMRWAVPRGGVPAVLLAAFAAATYVAGRELGGSWSWHAVGFAYGARHFKLMHLGTTSNLAAILGDQFGWGYGEAAGRLRVPLLGIDTTVNARALLAAAYFGCLFLCGLGAAAHARRDDPRVLIAVAAPWVIFFALMAQMHERYLVWAGPITAITVGLSAGMLGLHVVVTAIAALCILPDMLVNHAAGDPTMARWLGTMVAPQPGLGWMTVAVAMVYLYLSVAPRRRRPDVAAAPRLVFVARAPRPEYADADYVSAGAPTTRR